MNINSFIQIPCMLCGKRNTEIISSKGQYGIPMYVSICKNDGLVYLNPRWSEETYDEFYLKKYNEYYGSIQQRNNARQLKKQRVINTWNQIKRYQIDSVLDISAGSGNALQTLHKERNNMYLGAIESLQNNIKVIQKKKEIELIATDINTDWHLDNKERFKLIIIDHVFDQYLDPISVLEKVTYALAPNGFIAIAVPNMMKPKKTLDEYWFRVIRTYYFSQETLIRTAELVGLEPFTIMDHTNQVWGLFKKLKGEFYYPFKSVYQKQKDLITSYYEKGEY